MRLHGRGLHVSQGLGRETRRNEVLRLIRRVPRIVVVATIVRHNLDGRQSDRPTLQIHDRHGHVAALDALLHHQALAVGERIHHRPTQLLRIMRGRNTQRRATIRRLNNNRERHRPLKRRQDMRSAQLTENCLRQRHPTRRRQPRRTQQSLRRRLIRRQHRMNRRRPHKGNPHRFQERLQRAILANRPMHERPNHVRSERLNRARQRCINVRNHDVIAGLRQNIRDATTRTHRHVTLVRQTARNNQNFRSHSVLLLRNVNDETQPRPRQLKPCQTYRPFPSPH